MLQFMLFFPTETSMHWKCQVTAAARSPSIYSKLNIRQKSQRRIDCLWCIRCVSLILKFYQCLYFFLSNAAAFRSRSESLCGSHKPVPVEKFPSWINLYCLPLQLQPVQKAFSGMVWWGYTQPSVLSSLLCSQCHSLGFRDKLRHIFSKRVRKTMEEGKKRAW